MSNDTDVHEVTPTATTVKPEQEESDMRAKKDPHPNVVPDLPTPTYAETVSSKRDWKDSTFKLTSRLPENKNDIKWPARRIFTGPIKIRKQATTEPEL